MSRALASAYAASLARVGSWVIVLGLVFRMSGDDGRANLGVLALARATVGLLGYASLGLTPVLVRLLTRDAKDADEARRVYATAGVLIAAAATIGGALLLVYVLVLGRFGALPIRSDDARWVFLAVGIGTLIRAASDWFASALLADDRLVADSTAQVFAEVAFVLTTVVFAFVVRNPAVAAAAGFMVSSAVLFIVRGLLSSSSLRPDLRAFDKRLVVMISIFAGGVVIGQLSDWLYAPLNQVLINRHLGAEAVAAYAVAIQIDSGLLLAVGGLSAVMLPAAAIAFRDGDLTGLRRRYVRSWVASLALLAAASFMVCLLAVPLFHAWFGDSMPAARAILPLVLLHTTIGGTAAVGRSVLLGIGEVKAYTLSAVIGGVTNAVFAVALLTQTSLGLRGVVLATVLTVTLRCGVWMPWYTLRCLRPRAASSI